MHADLEGEATDDLRTHEQALNGTVKFDSNYRCDHQDKIVDAFAIARTNLEDPAMVKCLAYHGVSGERGRSAEMIVQEMSENMSTTVRCKDLNDEDGGEARVGIATEEIYLDKGHVANSSTSTVAETVLHEVAHNKGYRHAKLEDQGMEYRYTIPMMVKWCSSAISSGSFNSNTSLGEVPSTLSPFTATSHPSSTPGPVGGLGGSPNRDLCEPGKFASGLVGRAGSSQVDKLGLKCRAASGTGSDTSTTQRGGSGGSSFSDACPSGSLLIGIKGNANDKLRKVQGICRSAADTAANKTGGRESLTARGTSSGPSFERRCPTGQAIKGIRTRSGSSVDGFVLECEDVHESNTQVLLLSTIQGSGSGKQHWEQCPRSSILTGLFGNAGGELDRLGGRCNSVTDEGSYVTLSETFGHVLSNALLPARGGWGGSAWPFEECAEGEGLIGLEIRSGARIDAVTGLCANVERWSNGGSEPTIHKLARHGGSTGTAQTFKCPRDRFIAGWNIWEDTKDDSLRVFGLQAICIEPER